MSIIISTHQTLNYLNALLSTARLLDTKKASRSERVQDARERVAIFFCSQSQSVRLTSSIQYKCAQATFSVKNHGDCIASDSAYEISATGLCHIIENLEAHDYLDLTISNDEHHLIIRGAHAQSADLFAQTKRFAIAKFGNQTRYKEVLTPIVVPALYEFTLEENRGKLSITASDAKKLQALYRVWELLPKSRNFPFILRTGVGQLYAETNFASVKLSPQAAHMESCRSEITSAEIRVLVNLIDSFTSPSHQKVPTILLSERFVCFSYHQFRARLLTLSDQRMTTPRHERDDDCIHLSSDTLRERLKALHITTDKKRDWVKMTFYPDNRLLLEFKDHGEASNEMTFIGGLTSTVEESVSREYLYRALDLSPNETITICGLHNKSNVFTLHSNSCAVLVPKIRRS
ncbi:MAG: hypothetical protein LAT53_07275 [Idiomarina sp.]|nr:hypothetical protein [Idiomarina sp.]